ncbi:MAG TPA: sialidase family protein [Mycobacteriales bacterium]|nr:sialidase family protein [Mycobacteriales bacterium]
MRAVGQISRQDVAPQPGSEPDTLVEPDVAVSPVNPRIAVAVAHDGRFPDGGAVDISYAWTHDGGLSWHHAPMPFLTKAVGGQWDRVSDPVVAFGPDGTVYVSTLLISLDCPSAVGVSRSTDGGRTFGRPVLAHFSASCAVSDDKNWLVADTGAHSPHRGRLYQFWTPFLSDADGNLTGSPQAVRWSDDHGRHWSRTVFVSATDIFTQNSQPMIQPDGTITDTYLNFGSDSGREGPESRIGEDDRTDAAPAAETGDLIVARTSRDGGAHWSSEVAVTHDAGEGPQGIRCCLPSATADPVTGRLYVAWDSADPAVVALSSSRDGRHWSAPVRVNRESRPGLDHVNVDVTAERGRVYVSYGTRDTTVQSGRFVQQRLSVSADGGRHFGLPLSLGPRSDLNFAAEAGGRFPGDYIGSSVRHGRLYLVWCLSSLPPDPAATFHQMLWEATLTT